MASQYVAPFPRSSKVLWERKVPHGATDKLDPEPAGLSSHPHSACMSSLSLGEPLIVSLRSCISPATPRPPEMVVTMHVKALCKLQSPI